MKVLLILSFAAVTLTSIARADAPPPDGQKYVGYDFKLQGLEAYPDRVVVAWPWSTSNGSPTREYTVVANDTAIPVGRRSPDVALYAVAKADWETFVSAELGNAQPDGDDKVAALNAFLAPPRAAACDANPNPVHVIPESDPRSRVEEVFVVKSISATTCALERVASAPVASGSGCSGATPALAWALAALALLPILRRKARRDLTPQGRLQTGAGCPARCRLSGFSGPGRPARSCRRRRTARLVRSPCRP